MLAVIFIIALLSVLVFTNYKSGGSQLALQRSASKLAQDIRRAEEMAMSSEECKKCTPPTTIPPRYGIKFNTAVPDSYIFFADINENGTFEGPDELVDTVTLEKGVKIDKIFADGIPKSLGIVTFQPPDPIVYIRDPGNRSILKVQLIGGNGTKAIIVNKTGLIYVQ